VIVTHRPIMWKESDEKDVVTQSKHISDIHKMWLAHDRNPLDKPVMRANTLARYPPIGSNGNQGTTQIQMCDSVS